MEEMDNCCKCCGAQVGMPYDYCPWCWGNCKKELKEFYEGVGI